MLAEHHFRVRANWTGDRGTGTSGYRAYGRTVRLEADGKPDLLASSAKEFHGEADRWNPEELLVAALSQCHLLSYLHACVTRGVVVTGYDDDATGTMVQEGNGGSFREVVLRPRVRVAQESMIEDALAAHGDANRWCFIANSVNFPVRHEPTVTAGPE